MALVKIDPSIRRQRWVTNAAMLAEMLAGLPKDQLKQTIDGGITQLLAILNTAIEAGVSVEPKERELAQFRLECGIATGWSLDQEYLDRQVLFEITLLGPLILHAAEPLKQDYRDPGQKAADPKSSILFKIVKLAYLNRKVCLLAEKGLDGGGTLFQTKGDSNKNKTVTGVTGNSGETLYYANEKSLPLVELFIACQRVRCSTFKMPYKEEVKLPLGDLGNGNKGATFKTLGGCFDQVLDRDDRPFNKEVHRLRGRTGIGQPPEPHPDQWYLAVNAGALRSPVDTQVSTLGMIARGLGLPERCDISGTTTDAVGAAVVLARIYEHNRQFHPGIYVLCCATTMCMAGHHSLDEVAAAASLWSKSNYMPFVANSFAVLLGNLYDRSGNPFQPALAPISPSGSDAGFGWLNRKWESLLMARQNLKEIEFNDDLWNGAKIAAGLFLSR